MNKKYDKVMMDTAILWSKQSYCRRRKVGSVIAKDNRIISIGYNGTIEGSSNDCEEHIVECTNCGKKLNIDHMFSEDSDVMRKIVCSCGATHSYAEDYLHEYEAELLTTKDETIHAEQNAIAYAAKYGISIKDTTIYVTTSPCVTCAKLIVQSGITRVVYGEAYKNEDGIDLLLRHGISVKKV